MTARPAALVDLHLREVQAALSALPLFHALPGFRFRRLMPFYSCREIAGLPILTTELDFEKVKLRADLLEFLTDTISQ